ncbi:hypothetical protein GCM10011409_03580 [Lentibacillus populi]|uniref:Uncharacterized protein n=1 Tax=Lentibacillus populi TaxID=1827502 RepID=A0A9W5X3S6_9BACI|nr:hypothetical protein GCM10011409_03580 [Lentibacillus populi]
MFTTFVDHQRSKPLEWNEKLSFQGCATFRLMDRDFLDNSEISIFYAKTNLEWKFANYHFKKEWILWQD